MATIYGNDTDTDSIIPWRSMTTSINTSQNTQETATISFTSTSNVEEITQLEKYRKY